MGIQVLLWLYESYNPKQGRDSMSSLNHYFSKELRNSLIQHYGKVPSCAVIARDFSLKARDVEPVSIETVRKWLNGSSLPHAKRLLVLNTWIGIDLNNSVIDNVIQTNAPRLNKHMTSLEPSPWVNIENMSNEKKKMVMGFIDFIRDLP
jgi:hypothetical protein